MFSIVRFISIVSNQVEELALTDIDVAARGKIAVENCPALRVVYFMSLYMIGLSVKQLFCLVSKLSPGVIYRLTCRVLYVCLYRAVIDTKLISRVRITK